MPLSHGIQVLFDLVLAHLTLGRLHLSLNCSFFLKGLLLTLFIWNTLAPPSRSSSSMKLSPNSGLP